MSKKTISISEDLYNQLVARKEDFFQRWNEKQSFDDVIKDILQETDFYQFESAKHCLNCCDCEDCAKERNYYQEQEAQTELEKDWE